ncbi:D-alanyl-D-alanine carboxypeptidase family protein [Cohnella lupini]|uniref:D-alanyl-D-alanine carboxypeptidase n=1 Tax=Cohnella lupini TaxID=1294267 RepID=A0A3D9IIU6_9BACL|nr:D-alanyl-D-alanine carboxypeptidase family protein [Cohnella lupini]RED61577.1 D-alanyl-D-alanine carboxypeptidase [Cohnella lupini]
MFTWTRNRKAALFKIGLFVVPLFMVTIQATVIAATQNQESQVFNSAVKWPSPPSNHAKGAALADVTSGRLLFSQRGDEPMKIASLTKIMTAIVAIEHGRLDSTIKVSAKAAGKEGSSLYLKAGEKITLRNALYGLMLRSGNDAATAIAEHVGGSVEGFAYLMNKKAEEIGLTHSHFMNPHGLDEQGHYSSANDLAMLTVYALRNPDFKEIVGTRSKTVPNRDYPWINKNKMLGMYDGADGVKTGYTKQALRTLVSSATRDGQQLVAVTLNDGDDWLDHRKLLDYGFANFPLTRVTKEGEPIAGYPYQVTRSFVYPFAKGEREQLEIRLAPLKEGTVHYHLGYRGQLKFVLNDRLIGTVPFIEGISQSKPSTDGNSNKGADSRPSDARTSAPHTSFATSVKHALKALLLQGGS